MILVEQPGGEHALILDFHLPDEVIENLNILKKEEKIFKFFCLVDLLNFSTMFAFDYSFLSLLLVAFVYVGYTGCVLLDTSRLNIYLFYNVFFYVGKLISTIYNHGYVMIFSTTVQFVVFIATVRFIIKFRQICNEIWDDVQSPV